MANGVISFSDIFGIYDVIRLNEIYEITPVLTWAPQVVTLLISGTKFHVIYTFLEYIIQIVPIPKKLYRLKFASYDIE